MLNKHWKTLLMAMAFFFYCLGLFVNIVADYDFWGAMAFGRLFMEKGLFPYQDVFSYVPTKDPFVYHEWLTGVIFFLIHKHFGDMGIQLLRYTLIYATITLIIATAFKRLANPCSIFIVLFLTCNALTHGYAPVRAQVFTYLLFALSIYILESYKKDRGIFLLCWLIPIQILWCNLHGGFVAGLGLIALYAVGEGIVNRRLTPHVPILILASLATLINPYGFDYWTYIVQAIMLPRSDITEWMSIPAAVRRGMFTHVSSLFIGLAFVSLFLTVKSPKRDLTDILVLTVTAYLSINSIRHTLLFFVAFGSYTPILFSQQMNSLECYLKPRKIMRRVTKSTITLMGLLFVVLAFFSFQHFLHSPSLDIRTPANYYPTKALQWIAEHQWGGNVLPHFDWGEFIIWRCYPACRVSMDGRFETAYPQDLQKEYSDFLNGRDGWQNFLSKYPHDMVLIKARTKTDALMRNHPDWRLEHEDDLSVLFLRNQKGPVSPPGMKSS